MADLSERAQTLEGLLGDCVFALEALLASPDLNLDSLEQATRDAIEVAHETLQAVKAEIDEYLIISPTIGEERQRPGSKTWGFLFGSEGRTRHAFCQNRGDGFYRKRPWFCVTDFAWDREIWTSKCAVFVT